jgi:hypothetical protein
MIHGFFQMTAALDAARLLHDELAQWLTNQSPTPERNRPADSLATSAVEAGPTSGTGVTV